MTKEWIYRATKGELILEMEGLGLETEGTLDDLRRRMSQYVSEQPQYTRCTAPATRTIPPQNPPPGESATPIETRATETPAKSANQIRKWGCHFDGRDPLAFLERLDELRACYGFTDAQLLAGLPELFRGDALLWVRNNRHAWAEWDDFCTDFREYFLPKRYRAQLRREVLARTQKPDEPYKKFANELTTLMRRAGTFTPGEQLELLYENMHPRYKLYIQRESFRRAGELLSRASDIDDLEEQCRQRQPVAKTPAAAAAVYNSRECCWRCKQRGHTRFDCRRPAKKFCSQCGKDGVLTKECHPRPENTERTGDAADTPRSSE